ncbi:hypothetical protein K1719_039806 [Acacia pycnantha]|nr:hypothetical protein K1719_039806 [Acacia pycnantha]
MEAVLEFALNQGHYRSRTHPWVPCDLRTHPRREKRLLRRIESYIKKLGNSRFYHNFRDQLQTSSISEQLNKVLGGESKMQMVLYGIGRFESGKKSRFQLSLAILMQKDFKWIGNIEVFDPILSATECRILEALGCSVLYFNEHGKRRALKPTLFFMPHCELPLYTNLLRANWNPDKLSKVVIFGNSFHYYKKHLDPDMIKPILAAHRFTSEFIMRTNHRRLSNLFNDFSWIFFNPTEMELQFMNNLPYIIERKIDLQMDCCREKALMQEIERCINKCESSEFYYNFQDKLQTPPISEQLHMVMGLESKMQIVLYGIGSLELNKNSRLQLSLAILMQKHFKWIGDIQVFDPVLSVTECRVIKAFGCSILSLHQYRRWRALKPTVFFMPHCSSMLYNDFLKANWESSLLRNIALFANSFNEYARKDPYRDLDSMWYIYGARRFTKEFRMNMVYDKDYHNAPN